VRTLAEATLALVLFTDASSVDLGALRREAGLSARLGAAARRRDLGLIRRP
jgi:sodium/hydrogen antiporter